MKTMHITVLTNAGFKLNFNNVINFRSIDKSIDFDYKDKDVADDKYKHIVFYTASILGFSFETEEVDE